MKGKSGILALAAAFMMVFSVPVKSIAATSTTSKAQIKKIIVEEAKKQGLDPKLALCVAQQESRYNQKARSHVGAIGVFQLMPGTARDLKVNPYKTRQNIKGGIKYLKQMKRMFKSNRLALAAYNAGPGNVRKYKGIPPFSETRKYVRKIMKHYNSMKKEKIAAK